MSLVHAFQLCCGYVTLRDGNRRTRRRARSTRPAPEANEPKSLEVTKRRLALPLRPGDEEADDPPTPPPIATAPRPSAQPADPEELEWRWRIARSRFRPSTQERELAREDGEWTRAIERSRARVDETDEDAMWARAIERARMGTERIDEGSSRDAPAGALERAQERIDRVVEPLEDARDRELPPEDDEWAWQLALARARLRCAGDDEEETLPRCPPGTSRLGSHPPEIDDFDEAETLVRYRR